MTIEKAKNLLVKNITPPSCPIRNKNERLTIKFVHHKLSEKGGITFYCEGRRADCCKHCTLFRLVTNPKTPTNRFTTQNPN